MMTIEPSILFVAAVLAASLSACAPPVAAMGQEAPAPVAVRTAAIEWARRTPPIRAVGGLAGKEEAKLSFKVGGLVERLYVDEGATVRAGQRLATLKTREVDAAVTQARQGLEKSERDLARVQELFAGKAATLEQLQNATTAFDVAKAGLAGAAFNQEHAAIHAPATGKVLRRFVEPDETVAPGTPVFLLRASGRGWVVRVGVSDQDVVRVALGDRAAVTFEALPARTFEAVVSEIAEGASPATGTYELELRLLAPGAELRSGLIGEAVIRPAPTATYGFVPLVALLDGDDRQASVFVPRGGAVEKRSVNVAFIEGERAAVSSGLDGVEAVVTDGAARLATGTRIAVAR